jgi:hypothetical protein
VTEPKNTPPHLKSGQVLLAGASLSQQSSGKGVTGTSVTLTSNIEDSDVNQGCFTPVGSAAPPASTAGFCSDVLTFTWTGQFVDGTVKQFTCALPYTTACQTLDVSVTTTAQTLSLTVTDQTGDPVTGVLGPISVALSGSTSSGGGSNTVTVNKGQTATFSNILTVSYAGTTPVTLALTGSPSLSANQISCTASPATLSGPVTNQAVTVLCSTQGQVFAMAAPPSRNPRSTDTPMVASIFGMSSLPLVGLLLLPSKNRRRKLMKVWAVLGLLLLMVVFQAACGGGGGSSFGGAPVLTNSGTAAGTYSLTVSSATGLSANYGTIPNSNPPLQATSLTLIVQ